MIMAVVPEGGPRPLPVLNEASNGVVEYSVPFDAKGCRQVFRPSVSGYDYIVAAWGDSSFYSYGLAEKVWMTLGLTPRCVGNDAQLIIYDDLSLPELAVAQGEIATDFYWVLRRNISWKMSNEYLRKYLWLRGASAVRVFFYEKLLSDEPYVRTLMQGQSHYVSEPTNGWYRLDVREHAGAFLMQVWGSVEAVSPELSPARSADGLVWPGIEGPMTHQRADATIAGPSIILDDRFLERYEQNSLFDAMPSCSHGVWYCSPTYRGQWSFTECRRVGRNCISVPIRELYKPKPDREILHAYAHAIGPDMAASFDQAEEHIAAKVQRLIDVLISLGNNLAVLGASIGLDTLPADIVGFSRRELASDGWRAYPQVSRLAQVVPLAMTEQGFSARCKTLHEIANAAPDGFLKTLLVRAGCPHEPVRRLKKLKLLQGLLNILEHLNANGESLDSFVSQDAVSGWDERNSALAPLFLVYDFRNAHAHEALGGTVQTLQELGFDTAALNQGYGRAFDFVLDGTIASFGRLNTELARLLTASR